MVTINVNISDWETLLWCRCLHWLCTDNADGNDDKWWQWRPAIIWRPNPPVLVLIMQTKYACEYARYGFCVTLFCIVRECNSHEAINVSHFYNPLRGKSFDKHSQYRQQTHRPFVENCDLRHNDVEFSAERRMMVNVVHLQKLWLVWSIPYAVMR